MEFFKKIRSKPAIWAVIGILAVVLILLVLILPKDESRSQTGETEALLENSGEILEKENAGASKDSDESTEEESTADNKTSGDKKSGDKTSTEENAGDQKTDKETDKNTDKKTETTAAEKAESEENAAAEPEDVTVSNFSSFSGQFVEDGRDELVSNVAAILVTNTSNQFLDLATLEYTIDGKEATFVATGLPAGKSAWVMEENRMTISGNAKFEYQDCTTSLRDGVVDSTDKITIKSDGNMLTAVNNTKKTLKNVFVYYKSVYTDGNFFGGITYLVDFGTLEPGESVESMAGHYVKGETEIVRIGWQE